MTATQGESGLGASARAGDLARGLLDAMGDAVIATDLSGTIIYWNRFAETLYGWTREEAVGQAAIIRAMFHVPHHCGQWKVRGVLRTQAPVGARQQGRGGDEAAG